MIESGRSLRTSASIQARIGRAHIHQRIAQRASVSLKTSAHKLQISGIRTVAISARIRKARVDFRLTIVTSISGQTSAI